MKKGLITPVCVCACSLLFGPADTPADSPSTLRVGEFSSARIGQGFPEGWRPLTFEKILRHTVYEVVGDGEKVVVKAVSEAAASGLVKQVTIDPKEFPMVRWSWKVENLLKKSDVARKQGDDYPARLYITFAYDPDKIGFSRRLKYMAAKAIFGDVPIAALNYIWETRTPIESIVSNAYTDFAQMIVVESGQEKVGQWAEEERNIYEDYKRAFGGEPSLINGVAIMTDTDNTRERAVAFYGDIEFRRYGR